MSNERLIKMVNLLQKRTDDKKVFWEQTVNEDVYQSAFPNYTVQVGYRSNDHSFSKEVDYFIRVLDEDNKIIEEATDVDIKDELEDSYKIMEHLYRSARRQAMGVDKALDSILSELENGD